MDPTGAEELDTIVTPDTAEKDIALNGAYEGAL